MLPQITAQASAQSLTQLIAQLQHENEQLKAELNTDPLTGIGNRRAYDRRIAQPTGEETFIVIDVNLFKTINDTYGHKAGDRVLVAIAQQIRAHTDSCFRTGGDEFVIVLGDAINAGAIVERIRQAVLQIRIGEIQCSISAGIGRSFEAADQDMYHAKQQSRRSA